MRGFRTIISICIILLSLVLSAFAIFSIDNEPVLTEAQEGFVVKEFDGRLAIYANGADTPFEVTDIETKNLPKFDRENIQNGIFLADNASLAMILEDFGS